MARIGIIADIHANEEALIAVLAHLGRVDRLLCLGDVVGYGASPDRCIEILRDAHAQTILGNHELGLLGALDDSWFNAFARVAIEWQRARISADNVAWLSSLPRTLELDPFKLVHGAPPNSQTDYTLTVSDVERSMWSVRQRVCLVGHSHLPGVFRSQAGSNSRMGARWRSVPIRPNSTIRLDAPDRLLVNPGSVGQPRDRSPLASFAIFDSRRSELTIRRVPYAIHVAQKKIEESGLPTYLAERLAVGE